MKIIYNNVLPVKGYKAMTILNLIFVRKGSVLKQTDINHEEIHWKQEKELLIVGFYLWYVIEFLIRLALLRNWHSAYRSISFEREAYTYQNRFFDRKRYGWIKFL